MRKVTYILCIALLFIIPWEDSISVGSIGSLARLMGFVVAGCWFASIVIKGKFRKPSFFHGLVLLFFLWNSVSVYWSLDVQSTLQRIKTFSQVFLLMIIYWDVFQKPEDLMAGLQAYMLGAYVVIGSTLYNYMMGNVAVQYEGRYSATGMNAVEVALILILGLPIGLLIAMELFYATKRNPKGNLLLAINLLYIPLSIFAIILTGSRTSLIAIIPFMVYLVLTQRIKFEQKVYVSALLLISFFVVLPFAPSSVIQRISTISTSIRDADMGGRVSLWWEGIAVLAQRPMLGVGGGTIERTMGAAVHNTFLSIASETGFIGLILFLSILGLVIYKVATLPRNRLELWLTIFMIWMVGVLSISWEYRKFTWVMLSLIVIESSFVEQASDHEKILNIPRIIGKTKSPSDFHWQKHENHSHDFNAGRRCSLRGLYKPESFDACSEPRPNLSRG